MLQAAADHDPAVLPRLVGIGEIHLLFQQERTQMFVDLLQRGVFEGFIAAFLRLSLVDLIEGGPVLHDCNAGKLFQDPALRRVERALGLSRLESLVHCDDAFELCGVGARVKRHPFNHGQNRSGAVRGWRSELLNLLLHRDSSLSGLKLSSSRALLCSVKRAMRRPRGCGRLGHAPPGPR